MRKKIDSKPKLPIGVTDEFLNEIASADERHLQAMTTRLSGQINDAQKFLKEDPKVQELKEAYFQVKAPSMETIKACRNRVRYIVERLEQMGKL